MFRHKLRLIQNHLREYNGDVEVSYAHGLISIGVYASKSRFERAFRDVLSTIKNMNFDGFEIAEAKERVIRELTYEGISMREANKDVLRMILSYEFNSKDVLSDLQKNLFGESDINIKLFTAFAFFEGDISKSDAETYYDILDGSFKM